MGNFNSTNDSSLPIWVLNILEEEYVKASTFSNSDEQATTAVDEEERDDAIATTNTITTNTTNVTNNDNIGTITSQLEEEATDPNKLKGLTLDQFLRLDLNRLNTTLPLSLMDVATLVLADYDCDGLFSFHDLLMFSNSLYQSYIKYSNITSEMKTVQSLVRGEIAKKFWLLVTSKEYINIKNIDNDDEEEDDDDDVDMNDSTKSKTSTISSSSIVQGIESVSNRIIKILIQNRSTKFTSQPGVKFVDSDTVHTCFRMCAVARSNRVDFQTFFDLMQQEAEDLGLMDLEDAMLDNMLPLNVLRRFLNNFLKGISRMQVGK
jgi:hypothetical protein